LASALARVVLPDLGRPIINNCKGTIFVYCRTSDKNALPVSFRMWSSYDKFLSITMFKFLSYYCSCLRMVCSYL